MCISIKLELVSKVSSIIISQSNQLLTSVIERETQNLKKRLKRPCKTWQLFETTEIEWLQSGLTFFEIKSVEIPKLNIYDSELFGISNAFILEKKSSLNDQSLLQQIFQHCQHFRSSLLVFCATSYRWQGGLPPPLYSHLPGNLSSGNTCTNNHDTIVIQ